MTQAHQTPDLLPAVSRAVADLAAAAAASVVQVHGRPRRPASGLVIGPERVVTTSHSVEREDGVRVRTSDGGMFTAEVAGHAHGPDVVLLRVPGLAVPAFALDVLDTPRPGELVLVAGRAWSGAPHLRLVAVSGIGGPLRAADGSSIDRLIGLPLPPYPGVSGSAVIDPAGRLAALATAGIVRGRVFGLPATALRAIVESLEAHGTRDRGFLGVTTHAARLGASQAGPAGHERGLVIVGVAEGSPAAGALLVGDVIVAANGGPVSSPDDLLAVLGPGSAGTSIALRVVRGDAARDVQVTAQRRPAGW